jgi:hypothetical protein
MTAYFANDTVSVLLGTGLGTSRASSCRPHSLWEVDRKVLRWVTSTEMAISISRL